MPARLLAHNVLVTACAFLHIQTIGLDKNKHKDAKQGGKYAGSKRGDPFCDSMEENERRRRTMMNAVNAMNSLIVIVCLHTYMTLHDASLVHDVSIHVLVTHTHSAGLHAWTFLCTCVDGISCFFLFCSLPPSGTIMMMIRRSRCTSSHTHALSSTRTHFFLCARFRESD